MRKLDGVLPSHSDQVLVPTFSDMKKGWENLKEKQSN